MADPGKRNGKARPRGGGQGKGRRPREPEAAGAARVPAKESDESRRRVEEQRLHRARLSEAGSRRWSQGSEAARLAYLEAVRAALEAEGFASTPFQWRHKGHAYGLVKDLDDMQVHVRVYEDGVIDAEIEINKRYLQHLWSPRPSAHEEVQKVLSKHGIDTELVNEQYLPQVGALRERFPERRTKVSHVAGSAAAAVGGLVVASLARMYLKRR